MIEFKDLLSVTIASLSLIVSITAAVLTFTLARLNARNSVRPVIVFEYDNSVGWRAKNIGAGPALNLLIAQAKKNQWFNPVRTPALPKDGSIELSWCRHDNDHGLGALYEDVNGRPYTTMCKRDLSRTVEGHSFGNWTEDAIGKSWAGGKIVPPIS